ncbi:hypothetical protein ACUN29_16465 [Streptomyces sp. WC2508]|uniref:hypothetical protein n=1 Tax=Streptomyces sp. WC2508 TaxID=3461405 RepID=UPI004043E23F
MNPLLATLGTRLTERWLNLLVLPGALFLGVASAGVTLGHRHWHDLDRLRTAVDDLATRPALDRTGTAVLLAAGVLLAATAASLAAQYLAGVIELYWLRFARDPLSHALVDRRRRAWLRRDEEFREALRRTTVTGPGEGDTVTAPPHEVARLDALAAARDRVALLEPTRPTWYGDRMQAAAERVRAVHGVDLAALWPRLWLILAEPAGREIRSARDSFGAAARLASWAVGYALLAVWWWPAALIAVGCAAAARSRARNALDALADLIEAAVDVHGLELASRIGLVGTDSPGPLDHGTGNRMSELFRKAG